MVCNLTDVLLFHSWKERFHIDWSRVMHRNSSCVSGPIVPQLLNPEERNQVSVLAARNLNYHVELIQHDGWSLESSSLNINSRGFSSNSSFSVTFLDDDDDDECSIAVISKMCIILNVNHRKRRSWGFLLDLKTFCVLSLFIQNKWRRCSSF